jgi:DNA-binding transcriptional LysR family regulator
MACNSITFAREAALASAGIAALPDMICEEALRGGRLVQLLAEARLPVGELHAVYPSRRFQAMKAKTFLDFLMRNLPVGEGQRLEPAAVGLVTSPP